MTYEQAAAAKPSRMHVRRKQQKKVVFRKAAPDSDDEAPWQQPTQASATTATKQLQTSAPKPRRRRSKHRTPSLARRRQAPTLKINADATKDVENTEDLTEEHWTDAALEELFESALSAGSSPEHDHQEEQFFSAGSASPP
eukprot:m.93823 g.93823  ORF g.93823 m.93823 type:complete len:141 (+) comp14991_c0_seq1:100-522(+)